MIKFTYILYNIFYQVVAIYLLIYLQINVNSKLIPVNFLWNRGQLVRYPLFGTVAIEFVALLFEAAILIAILYFINKLYLRFIRIRNNRSILDYTTLIAQFVTLLAITGIMQDF